jgi:hypothetical protein
MATSISKPHPTIAVEKGLDDVEARPRSSDIQPLTPFQYRKLIWKLDFHILPPVIALIFVVQIDRVSIGSANIFGIQKDLGMDPRGHDFVLTLVLLAMGLATMKVPTTYIIKRTNPSLIFSIKCLLLGSLPSLFFQIQSSQKSLNH